MRTTTITAATIAAYRDQAQRVAHATGLSNAGVCLTVREGGDPRYVLWAIGTDGRITDHTLACSCTDEARLVAHAKGFAENHLAAWAAHTAGIAA